jgi:hypothetical protein
MIDHDHGLCPTCDEPFTFTQWDLRHHGWDGVDVHEECCEACDEHDGNIRWT